MTIVVHKEEKTAWSFSGDDRWFDTREQAVAFWRNEESERVQRLISSAGTDVDNLKNLVERLDVISKSEPDGLDSHDYRVFRVNGIGQPFGTLEEAVAAARRKVIVELVQTDMPKFPSLTMDELRYESMGRINAAEVVAREYDSMLELCSDYVVKSN